MARMILQFYLTKISRNKILRILDLSWSSNTGHETQNMLGDDSRRRPCSQNLTEISKNHFSFNFLTEIHRKLFLKITRKFLIKYPQTEITTTSFSFNFRIE